MSLEEFSQRVAQDEIKHSQTQSPSDPYYPQKSRTAYAKRYFYDAAYLHPYLQLSGYLKIFQRTSIWIATV